MLDLKSGSQSAFWFISNLWDVGSGQGFAKFCEICPQQTCEKDLEQSGFVVLKQDRAFLKPPQKRSLNILVGRTCPWSNFKKIIVVSLKTLKNIFATLGFVANT